VTFNRIIEVYRKVREESIPPLSASTFSNLREGSTLLSSRLDLLEPFRGILIDDDHLLQ
jgi:hypothetical protein